MNTGMDKPSLIVAAITAALFIAALFVKGWTHDLFLEAGLFLVSVKILIGMHAGRQTAIGLERKLDAILSRLERDRVPEKTAEGDSPSRGDRGLGTPQR